MIRSGTRKRCILCKCWSPESRRWRGPRANRPPAELLDWRSPLTLFPCWHNNTLTPQSQYSAWRFEPMDLRSILRKTHPQKGLQGRHGGLTVIVIVIFGRHGLCSPRRWKHSHRECSKKRTTDGTSKMARPRPSERKHSHQNTVLYVQRLTRKSEISRCRIIPDSRTTAAFCHKSQIESATKTAMSDNNLLLEPLWGYSMKL